MHKVFLHLPITSSHSQVKILNKIQTKYKTRIKRVPDFTRCCWTLLRLERWIRIRPVLSFLSVNYRLFEKATSFSQSNTFRTNSCKYEIRHTFIVNRFKWSEVCGVIRVVSTYGTVNGYPTCSFGSLFTQESSECDTFRLWLVLPSGS